MFLYLSNLKEYIQNYDGRVYWRRLIGETENGKEIINNINENYIFKDDEQAEAKKDN